MRPNYNTQRFQGFVQDLQESFWGDFQGRAREALKKFLEADAEQQMAEYLGLQWYERPAEEQPRVDYRNGFYERDYVTPLGAIRVRVPRTRQRSFLPRCIRRLERRSPEVAELIRQAFLRGISTRQVGRVVAVLTGEEVSAQTVSVLTRVLNRAVQEFHHAPLDDDWAYLVHDGVWLKVRGGGTTRRSSATRRKSTWRRTWPARGGRSSSFVFAGGRCTRRWCGNWSAICPSCCTSSPFPGTCGGSCAPPTPSNAASSKCAAAPGQWWCSPTWRAWIGSSMRFSAASTKNGKTEPSPYLHKQLDVTFSRQPLCRRWKSLLECGAGNFPTLKNGED